ncbi:hypothetical protein LWI28_004295 [Acer negundo]|uniref:Transposase-associated domain-containing protein n=1 Tax=Acer negundo TaxID=4023 RepID=A0AAD5JCA3_ACENE|nr:hypothetical protein LWI28_004295 [Acer negundo]
MRSHNMPTIKAHSREYGFSQSYGTWIFHGEQIDHTNENLNEETDDLGDNEGENDDGDDYIGMLNDTLGLNDRNVDMGLGESINDSNNDLSDGDGDKFNDLFVVATQELYAGCTNFSVLSFIVKLMHIKVLNHWSNKSFDLLLQFLKDVLPEGSNISLSHYNANKMLRDLGLGYESTHACKHDCALFWKEHVGANKCSSCNESRYQIDDGKVLVPYNLSPWKCMKTQFLMMSLLIPDPQAPGKNIDVYLRPLIDELKELWDHGVNTYDVCGGETFRLRACIMWTINDFPVYANLSGWSTKGYKVCPVYNGDSSS